MDQTDLTGIYRAFHLTVAEYTLFLSIYGAFSRTETGKSKSKSQQIRKNWNQTMYLFWPQWNKSGNQQLRNSRNSRKYANTWRLKKYITEWIVDHARNQRETKNS